MMTEHDIFISQNTFYQNLCGKRSISYRKQNGLLKVFETVPILRIGIDQV